MPIYEYRCKKCGKKTEFITFRVSEPVAADCRHCGSDLMEKVPSRVRVRLSEETRMERLADPALMGGMDENDPRSMAKWMKKIGHEMGEDMGEDVDAMVEEAMESGSGPGEEGNGGGFPDDE